MNENSQLIGNGFRTLRGDPPAPSVAPAHRSSRDSVHALLNDNRLDPSEKRAILASWISDARAVVDAPALRRLDDGVLVAVDDILDALKAIDSGDGQTIGIVVAPHRRHPGSRRGARIGGRWLGRVGQPKNPDDDRPPPCPAAVASPVRRSSVDACAPTPVWRPAMLGKSLAAA